MEENFKKRIKLLIKLSQSQMDLLLNQYFTKDCN